MKPGMNAVRRTKSVFPLTGSTSLQGLRLARVAAAGRLQSSLESSAAQQPDSANMTPHNPHWRSADNQREGRRFGPNLRWNGWGAPARQPSVHHS